MSEQTIFSGGKVMSDLQIFKNEKLGLQIRCILNEDGSISMNAEDTAKGFGFTKTDKRMKAPRDFAGAFFTFIFRG